MGLLDGLRKLLGLGKRAAAGPEASPLGLFGALFRENYAFLTGSSTASLEARNSSFEAWDGALSRDGRISVLKLHDGAARPSAWLFFGSGSAAWLREAYHRSRSGGTAPLEGGQVLRAELAAVELLSESLGAALAAEGSAASLSYDILDPGALQLFRWVLCDCRFLEFSGERGSFFLAIDAEAHEHLLSRLELPSFMQDILGRVRSSGDDRSRGGPLGEGLGRLRNEELKIEGVRDFPLASILAPRRLALGFGEARLRPEALLICADSAPLEARSIAGYRMLLRFSSASKFKELSLYLFASAMGPFEAGSEEWRALLKAAASRCAAALGRLLRLEVAVRAATSASPEDALASGPLAAISYNASIGGARGRLVVGLGLELLSIAASRLFGPDEIERLRLSSRNIFLAVEAINARIDSASFAGYRKSLGAVPAAASTLASRLPVGGRPLYSILEELGERDIAAILGKLAQKGFMRREQRYAFFLHASSAEDGPAAITSALTPCEDYEALFARFPRRWDEADGARPGLFPAFRSLDELLTAHYEAVWLLYRELLADRLSLSGRGEAVLRASGEAFAARLRGALEEQGGELERLIGSLDAPRRNALPWADRARLLLGLPRLARALAPSIGERAAEALADSIAAAGARLADGREDAYELWKARRAFAVELRERQA